MHKSFELFSKLAIQHKLDVNNDDDCKKLLSLFEARVKELGKSPTFVYGKRTENAFFEIVKSLNNVKLIKEEDTERFYSKLDIKIPDYRVITKDNEQFLVEIKNYSPPINNIEKQLQYPMEHKYWEELKKYSEIVQTPIKIGIFWRSAGLWTLNDLDDFESTGIKRRIKLTKACQYTQMYKLGDKMIGTKNPLVFQLIMEPKPLDIDKSNTEVSSKVTDVQILTGDNVIQDKQMAYLAYQLFWFGCWKIKGPDPIIRENIFHGIEYSANPEEKAEGQGFDIIATLSSMYMRMFYSATDRGEELPKIYLKDELLPISKIIPENPFHRGMPLWIFKLLPSSD